MTSSSIGSTVIIVLSLIVGARVQAQQVQSARDIAKKVLPSTVLIVATQAEGKGVSFGSGFFVQPNVIATNYHVINGASQLSFRLVGHRDIHAVDRVLAVDAKQDLALIRVSGVGAKPLMLGKSGLVEVGERVYAVGNPEGLEGTVSEGIVSGLRQTNTESYIQIFRPSRSSLWPKR